MTVQAYSVTESNWPNILEAESRVCRQKAHNANREFRCWGITVVIAMIALPILYFIPIPTLILKGLSCVHFGLLFYRSSKTSDEANYFRQELSKINFVRGTWNDEFLNWLKDSANITVHFTCKQMVLALTTYRHFKTGDIARYVYNDYVPKFNQNIPAGRLKPLVD